MPPNGESAEVSRTEAAEPIGFLKAAGPISAPEQYRKLTSVFDNARTEIFTLCSAFYKLAPFSPR